MASPSNTIDDAFQKLQRSVSQEDAHDWASTELKDVWAEVRRIDFEQRKRQSAQNMRRIEPFLKGIENYSKVIEVLCNGTPYLPYVWAPIKLMLQLASQHGSVFESLLSAYSEIGAALPRFDRYEKAFKENLEFQNVLASVYANILDFHQRAYKFFRRRAWHLIFTSLWKDFQSRFQGIIDSLKKQRDFVDREAASIDIVEAKEHRLRTQQDMAHREKDWAERLDQNERSAKSSQLRHSIEWLAVDEKNQEDSFARISHRRHDETCQWVMREAQMIEWVKNGSKRPVLWLNGKPGAGKSVMCSYIAERLLGMPDVTVCYYFCNNKDQGTSSTQILRTIALQLLRSIVDIASLISNEFVYRGLSCGLPQLKTLISQILQIVPCTRILIDGVDECSKDVQKAALRDLQAFCAGSATTCKVLFSSRKEVYINDRLSGKQQISLDNRDEVETDIRLYVKHKMQRLRTSDEELLSRIESVLVEKANGMFLWVRLVVEELRYCYSDADLENAATSLPKGLQKAYGRILDRIVDASNPSSARSIAIRILEWMACSYRPLKTYEILDGIVFRPGSTILNERTKMHDEVLDLCRPLIEDGPSNTLDFVHFSAKEYILQEEYRNGTSFVSVDNAQHNISFSCIAYLNTSLFLASASTTDHERVAAVFQGLHGLQIYANRYWFDHLLQYCASQARQGKTLPRDICTQLTALLMFRKEAYNDRIIAGNLLASVDQQALTVLDQIPLLKTLVTDVLVSRSSTEAKNQLNSLDKSTKDHCLSSCSSDPTQFTDCLYHYQLTLESILNGHAQRLIPSMTGIAMKKFADTYGASAFACHYSHCSRATDGFASARQRDLHEANHQRKFRCAHPSCAYYSSGFATRGALKKHNEKYHRSIEEQTSLSDLIGRKSVPRDVSVSSKSNRPRSDHRNSSDPGEASKDDFIDMENLFSFSPYGPSEDKVKKPASVSTGRGTYPCTYQGCNLRFNRPTALGRHLHEDHSHRNPIVESVGEEDDKIKCICDYSDDDGNTIYCESCDTWQHIECFYPGRVNDIMGEDFDHSCADCKPRPLDRRSATERQRHHRENNASNNKGNRETRRSPLKKARMRSPVYTGLSSESISQLPSRSTDHEFLPSRASASYFEELEWDLEKDKDKRPPSAPNLEIPPTDPRLTYEGVPPLTRFETPLPEDSFPVELSKDNSHGMLKLFPRKENDSDVYQVRSGELYNYNLWGRPRPSPSNLQSSPATSLPQAKVLATDRLSELAEVYYQQRRPLRVFEVEDQDQALRYQCHADAVEAITRQIILNDMSPHSASLPSIQEAFGPAQSSHLYRPHSPSLGLAPPWTPPPLPPPRHLP
ncbi:Vegetative incompatibility protein HET-E-1 [Lachnellula suecica]|uniref:Vegetative incompatibility protein HET-E-1 n=1 Tax=Lachnellula suecica TaxID=602035 RepID=A0A8T9C0L3_9HELO|nr:Vegetative incompatibility protein HET-E-1 [Lachnellula suecica]